MEFCFRSVVFDTAERMKAEPDDSAEQTGV